MSLSPAELAGMRDTMEDTFPGTCIVQRKTTVNQGGEVVETWTDRERGVPCRIAPAGGGETGETGARISQETTHLVTLPAATDIEEADRLSLDGTTYEVTLVRKRGEWELSRRVEVREAV